MRISGSYGRSGLGKFVDGILAGGVHSESIRGHLRYCVERSAAIRASYNVYLRFTTRMLFDGNSCSLTAFKVQSRSANGPPFPDSPLVLSFANLFWGLHKRPRSD